MLDKKKLEATLADFQKWLAVWEDQNAGDEPGGPEDLFRDLRQRMGG